MKPPVVLCVDEDVITLEHTRHLVQRHADKLFGERRFEVYAYTSFAAATAFYKACHAQGRAVALVLISQCLAGSHCTQTVLDMLNIDPTQPMIVGVGDMDRLSALRLGQHQRMPALFPKPWQKENLLQKVGAELAMQAKPPAAVAS